RAAAVPVLCGALRVHHLRQELVILGRGAPLDAVGSLREWVHGLAVSEREAVAGIEVLLVLAVVTRRLGEAVVEEAEPATGDVRHQAVEYFAASLIDVEPLVQEVAQEPTTLRDAEAVRPGDRGLAVRGAERVVGATVVLQEGDQVAGRGIAEPLHDRALGLANQLVDIAGLESTLQV